jgi:hypothetical protein
VEPGNGAVNVDGHVHFIKFEDFQREQRLRKPGLLGCVPDTRNGQ